ncbi:MAG: hypothetical protein HY762_00565 [Planctomycetes bacterium]|nr:hypothetical protein [Planctomycetota bacterium]
MSKKYWVVIVCLISIAGVMQGCGVGLLATLGAASSGSSGGNKDSGPSAPPSAFWLSNPK